MASERISSDSSSACSSPTSPRKARVRWRLASGMRLPPQRAWATSARAPSRSRSPGGGISARKSLIPLSVADDHHGFRLELGALGQRLDADGSTRRIGHLEELLHHLVDHREVVQVDQVEVELDDLAQGACGLLADGLEVGEDLAGLGLEVVGDDLHGGRVQGDLAGEVDGVAGLDGLGVGADGGGRQFGIDHGLVAHGVLRRELWCVITKKRPGCPIGRAEPGRWGNSVAEPGDPLDVGEVAQPLDDARQVDAVAYRQGQVDGGQAGVPLLDADTLDVGVGVGDHASQFGHQPAAALHLEAQRHGKSSAISSDHSRANSLSGSPFSSPRLRHSARCTTIPLPTERWPMTGSPGSGWQQRANLITMPSAPLITMGPWARGLSPSGATSPWCRSSRRRATTWVTRLPSPMDSSKASSFFRPSSCRRAPSGPSGSSSRLVSNSDSDLLSSRRPSWTASVCCWCLRAWRIAERALAVATKLSQVRLGRAPGAVMISRVWPLSSRVESGARWRSMRQAMVLLPISVCTL